MTERLQQTTTATNTPPTTEETIGKVATGVAGVARVIAPLIPRHTILYKVLAALAALGAAFGLGTQF